MPINRAPFNSLVDDDGSNTVGSIWNKAAIQQVILDPVDVALSVWGPIAFNGANFWAGVTAGHVAFNNATTIGRTLLWTVQVVNAPVPSPGNAYLTFLLPTGTFFNSQALVPGVYAHDNGAYTASLGFALTSTTLAFAKSNFTNWTGPLCSCYFTAVIGLA